MRYRSSLYKLIVLLGWAAVARADGLDAAASLESIREQFMLAHTAVRSGLLPDVAVQGDALRVYPLYPYLEAAIIEQALGAARGIDTQADRRAAAFLERHEGEPVSRDLRRAWLRSLAERADWQTFVEQYAGPLADATLRCRYLEAHIALERDEAEPLALEQWLTPHRLPAECEPAFQWLRDRQTLDEALVERRVRLLLGNGQPGFARIIARRLPEQRAEGLLRWADFIERPREMLDAWATNGATAGVELRALVDGWARLTRNQPGAALELYRPLVAARGIEADHVSKLTRSLALGLSWDRRPEALEFFARVAPEDLDDYALEWQARAALWAEDWAAAERSIAAMSAEQRAHARWRYWAARSAEALGERRRARELYASVLGRDNYYAAMAAARLGRPAAPNPEPLRLDEPRLAELAARPSFVRARELKLSRLHHHAVAEWLYGFNTLGDSDRYQAVHLAARWGWHDVSVASATRQRVFNDYELLYPRPFDEHVSAASELADVDAELIYGVIRQESLFRADAVSPAGALGAAQLLPDTARSTARRWNLPAPRRADLFDPGVNIRLAAAHLRDLHDRFSSQTVVALAAYNAGPNAAARWLPDRPLDADVWIENIPYNETRDYVQRVLWHTVVFGWLRTGSAQSTEAWIARVAPPHEETLADTRPASQ